MISRAQVRQVARLARLELTPEEEELFAAQLQHVLEYVERLSAVDVEGVEPLAFAGDVGHEAPMRDDASWASLDRERVLEEAPEHDGASFVVPRIIE